MKNGFFSSASSLKRGVLKKSSFFSQNQSTLNTTLREHNNSSTSQLECVPTPTFYYKCKSTSVINDNDSNSSSFLCLNPSDMAIDQHQQNKTHSNDRQRATVKSNQSTQRSTVRSKSTGPNTFFISKQNMSSKSDCSLSKQYQEFNNYIKDELLQQQRNKIKELKRSRDHVAKTWKHYLEVKNKKESNVIRINRYRIDSERRAKRIEEYRLKYDACSSLRRERFLLTKKKEVFDRINISKRENEYSIEESQDFFLMNNKQQSNQPLKLVRNQDNKSVVFDMEQGKVYCFL